VVQLELAELRVAQRLRRTTRIEGDRQRRAELGKTIGVGSGLRGGLLDVRPARHRHKHLGGGRGDLLPADHTRLRPGPARPSSPLASATISGTQRPSAQRVNDAAKCSSAHAERSRECSGRNSEARARDLAPRSE
jgi:hypothetical protein